MKRIPFCEAYINRKERRAVNKVMKSGWLTSGSKVKEFEKMFSEYTGWKYSIAVNSGTSALFLSAYYYFVHTKKCNKKGCPVIKPIKVPSFTFSATASVVRHIGLPIEFVDISPVNLVATGADICVSITGNQANNCVIEDSAHRVPNAFRNTKPGKCACYSFYATKNITTGEGGMIGTDDKDFYEWAKLARQHGINKDNHARYKIGNTWEYSVVFPGWKMNMTDINAAIGIEQLKKADEIEYQRTRCVQRYNKNLNYFNSGTHLYPIFVPNRKKFLQYMLDNKIQCSVHFLPLHLQPAYKQFKKKLPITEKLGKMCVSLPLYPGLKNRQIDYICKVIKKYKG